MSIRILAIDATTEACSVALLDNHEVTAHYELCPREHTQRILPMVQALLSGSELKLTDLDALAFSCGPGSFTGVRIGIGIAQGLALGADLPMLSISTLKTLAQGAYRTTKATKVLSTIDARMGELYWGKYERQQSGEWLLSDNEAVLKPEEVKQKLALLEGNWAYAGTGWQSYPSLVTNELIISGEITIPQAQDMLPIAQQDWLKGLAVSVENVEPIYLRNEVTWKKLPGRV